MDLKTFFASIPKDQRDSVAKAAGTRWVYVSQIIRNHRKPSPALAQQLHQVSEGKIPLSSLRPDVWAA